MVGLGVAAITAALVALGSSQGQGRRARHLPLFPMPAAALAVSLAAREFPSDWRFARTFSAALIVSVGLASTGLVGGFGMFGWLGRALRQAKPALSTTTTSSWVAPNATGGDSNIGHGDLAAMGSTHDRSQSRDRRSDGDIRTRRVGGTSCDPHAGFSRVWCQPPVKPHVVSSTRAITSRGTVSSASPPSG